MALGQMGAFMKRVDGDGKRHEGMGPCRGVVDRAGSNIQQEQG